MATEPLTTELVLSGGYATKAGASRAVKTADRAFYARRGVGELGVRWRWSAEWKHIGIDKEEFVVVGLPVEPAQP